MERLKSKKVQIVITAVICVLIIAGGSFAWFSATQNVLNEFSWNPEGVNLHDDFTDPNKDVYVENASAAPVLVRIKFREYMEIGDADVIPTGGKPKPLYDTWNVHKGATDSSIDDELHGYWDWIMSGDNGAMADGRKWYIPATKEQTEEIGDDAVVQNWVSENGVPHGKAYNDHADDYEVFDLAIRSVSSGSSLLNDLITDLDEAKEDLLNVMNASPSSIASISSYRSKVIMAQRAVNALAYNKYGVHLTRPAEVIPMAVWKGKGSPLGEFWVEDEDGWFYWATPLESGEATGLLLDAVIATQKISDLKANRIRYYYGIYVTMQSAYASDFKKYEFDSYTGPGESATGNALALLKKVAEAIDPNVVSGASAGIEAGTTRYNMTMPTSEPSKGSNWYYYDGVWMFADGRWRYDGNEWRLDGQVYPFNPDDWYTVGGDWNYFDDDWYFDGNTWYYIGEDLAPTPKPTPKPTYPTNPTNPTNPASPAPTPEPDDEPTEPDDEPPNPQYVPDEEHRGPNWYMFNGKWCFSDSHWHFDGTYWLLDGKLYSFNLHGWYESSGVWCYADSKWTFDGNNWKFIGGNGGSETPNPTPEPTPEPTPNPTPNPTPEPTPEPEPEPDSENENENENENDELNDDDILKSLFS